MLCEKILSTFTSKNKNDSRIISQLVRIALCALCLGYYTHREKKGYLKNM